MNKMKQLCLIIWLSTLVILPLHAQSTAINAKLDKSVFNPVTANKAFDKITLRLSSKKVSVKKLNGAIDELKGMRDDAQDCVEHTTNEINSIDNQVKALFGKETQDANRVDSKYLLSQKSKLVDREAKCQLFVIRADEAIKAYRENLLTMKQEITFTRGDSLFKRFSMMNESVAKINIPEHEPAFSSWFWWYFAGIIFGYMVLSWVIIQTIRRRYHSNRAWYVKVRWLGILGFLMLSSFVLWLSSYSLFIDDADNNIYHYIVMEFLVVVFAWFSINVLFAFRRFSLLISWYGFDAKFLRRILLVIVLISGIRYVGEAVLDLIEAKINLKQLFSSVMMLISMVLVLYFSNQFYHKHQQLFSGKINIAILKRGLWLVILTLIVLDILGFYILANYVSHILISSLLVGGLSLVLLKGFNQAYRYLNTSLKARYFLKQYFGYNQEPPYFELALLKILGHVVIMFGLVYLFAYLIGEASYFIDTMLEYLVNGFIIGGYQFIPSDWLIGLLVFCLIVLASRYISRRFTLQSQSGEEEIQVALASILLYIGFAVAVIMGLIIAGLNFTSLAIIAGALSVGIGLGLQSIVNNFFSGLILLLEKPIKAGDRIIIGDIEGFVKKVRVRSTQLRTPSKEDIIIPNSDLITEKVTNLMFADKMWRITCPVGVAYGSDTDLVRQVLLDVASGHNEVVQSHGFQPRVLFKSFGDSALNFELWCTIRDVNKKYMVASDLNFAIDKAFRVHSIEIAFPQQDVHLKFDPPKPEPEGDN